MGRSWPDVATSSRPAISLGSSVPPLPRTGRPGATDSRETGRIAVEDRPRPVLPGRAARPAAGALPAPRPAGDAIPTAAATDLTTADPQSPAPDTTTAPGTTGPDATGPDTVGPAGEPPAGNTDGEPIGVIEAIEAIEADADADRARRPSRRRVPSAPGRKPALLLVALVVGALIAALPGRTEPVAADAASGLDYGLGMEADTGFAGGVDLAGARGEISEAEAQARLSEIAASRAARQPAFVVPTQGRLTTCFCMRWGSMHWGLDLAAPLGTPINAAADGVVLRAGAASGYGKAIYIQDADGDVHVYGHMRYLYVEAGDVVSAGDLIAKVGNEGQSTGPHLHYEIHQGGINGKPTDPEDWLGERGISVR